MMNSLNTAPVYGDLTHIGCSKVFVRFKESKMQDINHHVGDSLESKLILVNFNPLDSTYTLTYVNDYNMVLRRIAYSRECVAELFMQESICRVLPPKPPLKVV